MSNNENWRNHTTILQPSKRKINKKPGQLETVI